MTEELKSTMKAIFIDKDGTLLNNVPYNVDLQRMTLSKGAGEGLRLLARLDYLLLVVTNQSGIAKGYFDEAALQSVKRYLTELLNQDQVRLDGFYYCPHDPDGSVPRYALKCSCRKPMPGMLLQAAREHNIDLSRSWMIGDILHDIEAGCRAGCRTVLIDNGNETEWELSAQRTPDFIATDLYEAAIFIANQGDAKDSLLMPGFTR